MLFKALHFLTRPFVDFFCWNQIYRLTVTTWSCKLLQMCQNTIIFLSISVITDVDSEFLCSGLSYRSNSSFVCFSNIMYLLSWPQTRWLLIMAGFLLNWSKIILNYHLLVFFELAHNSVRTPFCIKWFPYPWQVLVKLRHMTSSWLNWIFRIQG